MNPLLRGYATGVIEAADQDASLARMAEELAQVDSIWSGSAELKSALADSSVPASVRRAVVEDLFGTRVSPLTLRLLVRIVGRNKSAEYSSGVHDVAEMVRHATETTEPDPEAGLGRSGARDVMAGYAAAVLESLPSRSELEEVEDELFRFARIVESAPDLQGALSDGSRPLSQRQQLVTELMGAKVSEPTLALVKMALASRARHLVGALDFLVEQTAEARGWRLARVMAASDVDDDERAKLSAALQGLAGVPVDLQVTLDPSLLGGAVVQIGDVIVDASAKGLLGQLREHLLGPEGATRRVKEPN
ncbi:MAG: ATP synthase F1 subunit delta [Acidimicrobiales bacterium]